MEITMMDLKDKAGRLPNDELILDVRTAEEFAEGHVPGAKNIPYDEVGMHAAELKKFKKVYLYCRSGGRVGAAFQDLQSMGLQNLHGVFDGGMPDWFEAGLPVEK